MVIVWSLELLTVVIALYEIVLFLKYLWIYYDIDQKACRKRQLCYKLIRKSQASYAITDIILLSRTKKAPEGFNLVG